MKIGWRGITEREAAALACANGASGNVVRPASRHRGRLVVLLAIAITTMVAVLGCGEQRADRATAQGPPSAPAVQPSESSTGAPATEAAVASHGGEPTSAAGAPGSQPGNEASDQAEALPPDVVLSVGDTLVEPGQPIEISARGTADIATLVLWDGINDKQAFTYDTTAQLWRVSYRVPLQPAAERIGLSVTARNAANRWRRVWLFLHLQSPASEAPPAPATKS